MRRAALYARISADRTGERAGVDRQERECRELAARQGWEVAGLYVDNDVSAYRGKPRPHYQRLLADLEAGEVDAVVAWHPDRLYRHTRDLERFVEVAEQARAPIATVTAGDLDLATPAGRAVARTLGAWARYEGEQKAERHMSKDRQMAEDGRPHGGPRTYGYRYQGGTLRIVPQEAKVVRELADRALAGESLHELARDLTARGVPTSRGSESWHHQTIRRLLRSPALAGLRVHHGQVARAGDWAAILSVEQHRALDALLSDPARLTSRTPRRYLLTSIARCELCGAGLQARPKMDRRRNYLCRGCGKIGVLADPLEDIVVAAVLRRVESADFEAQLRESRAGGEIDQIEGQLADLAHLWGERQITRQEWMAAREPLQRRLEAQRREEAQRARSYALEAYQGEALRTAWPKLDLARRRTVLLAVVDAVIVGPALPGRNRFDPNRVSVRWRA